jgi:hypothetical protein
MDIKYRNDNIEMIPEDNFEEMFARKLCNFITAASNEFFAWYGDMETSDGTETGGYGITWKWGENPREKVVVADE